MSTATDTIESLVKQEYKYGFVTDVESDSTPPGLSEDTIRFISAKKSDVDDFVAVISSWCFHR